MRKLLYLFIFGFAGCMLCSTACNRPEAKPAVQKLIKVGVFDKNGDSPACIIDAVEALRIDQDIDVSVVSASDIVSGCTEEYDVFLFPGGSGRGETNSLGEQGIEKIQQMVIEQGKGVIGICAGAYILTNTPDYPGFGMSGAKAIDIEHDHRGNGLAKFTLNPQGKELFPELKSHDTLYCQYYEGPVLAPADEDTIKFTSLAVMQSDVHLIEGSPANMTNNKPFIIISEAGKGRTCSFVGHPECSPGMRWLVPRMARWAARKDLVEYQANVVRPKAFTKEILFNSAMRAEQYKRYDQLFGTDEEQIEAIEWLVENMAWSGKKWIIGLLRDKSAAVRLAAAKGILALERTDALNDLNAALQNETDLEVKKQLKDYFIQLQAMVGANKK